MRSRTFVAAVSVSALLVGGTSVVEHAQAFCGSLCTPNGLASVGTELGVPVTETAVATSAPAAGVGGLSIGSLVSATAGAVAGLVGLSGWPAADIEVDQEVTGLADGVDPLAGWVAYPGQARMPVGEYWTSLGAYFRGTVSIEYDTASGGTMTIHRYFGTGLQDPTGFRTVYSQPMEPITQAIRSSGVLTGWKTFGPVGSATATQSLKLPAGASGFTVGDHRWYAPGQPNRPADRQIGSGTVTRKLWCLGPGGTSTLLTDETVVDIHQPGLYPTGALSCPAGTVASAFASTWTPDGGAEQELTPWTQTPAWVRSIPDQYPECLVTECLLGLFSLANGHLTSCEDLAVECADWYVDRDRATSYECHWGDYVVSLDRCSVFRDPGRLLTNARPNAAGEVEYVEWPALPLDSGPVQRLIGRLQANYGTSQCAVFGEAARGAAPTVSVPDTVIVCESLGVAKALEFIQASAGTDGLAVQVLAQGADGPAPLQLNPECDWLAEDGSCLDEGAPPVVEPEPEPAGAGAGIAPPPSCLDTTAGSILRDSMPLQYHHMATIYGDWAAEFERIVSRYQLSLQDTARVWNAVQIPHRGPHPAEYHMWVLDNLIAADDVANGDVAVLQPLFKAWVVDVVSADPTIVRVAYWKCYR